MSRRSRAKQKLRALRQALEVERLSRLEVTKALASAHGETRYWEFQARDFQNQLFMAFNCHMRPLPFPMERERGLFWRFSPIALERWESVEALFQHTHRMMFEEFIKHYPLRWEEPQIPTDGFFSRRPEDPRHARRTGSPFRFQG